MAIAVTPSFLGQRTSLTGEFIRSAKLVITGLTPSSNNTVPHGLPTTPQKVILQPQAAGGFSEFQPADASNIYVNANGAGTSVNAYVEY